MFCDSNSYIWCVLFCVLLLELNHYEGRVKFEWTYRQGNPSTTLYRQPPPRITLTIALSNQHRDFHQTNFKKGTRRNKKGNTSVSEGWFGEGEVSWVPDTTEPARSLQQTWQLAKAQPQSWLNQPLHNSANVAEPAFPKPQIWLYQPNHKQRPSWTGLSITTNMVELALP